MGMLRDYDRECPDRMRSLHNFLAFSAYAGKIMQSDFLIDRSVGVLDLLQAELFPGGENAGQELARQVALNALEGAGPMLYLAHARTIRD